MIDEEWLAGLRFVGPGGARVDGLAGVGKEKVVLRATMPDGKEVVLAMYKHRLGFHIREVPLFLTNDQPLYDLERLNRKLARLVGNPLLDEMTREYDRLVSSLINILREHGLLSLLMFDAMRDFESTDAVPFILHAPGLRRRLRDWSALPRNVTDPKELILTVNGPSFPFHQGREQLIDWATALLAEIETVPPTLRPEELPHNPLYVWGAAAMDGFFTDEELPQAAAFVESEFGPLRKHPRAVIFLEQAKALAQLLVRYLKDSEVERFLQLCALLGFSFHVRDLDGRLLTGRGL